MRRLHLNLVAVIRRNTATRSLRVIGVLLLAFTVAGVLPRPAGAAAGDLDPNFGVGGKRTTDVFGQDDVGSAVVVQPDGKIVVAGVGLSGDVGDFVVARYTSDGTPDSSFGTNGKTTTDFFADVDIAFGVKLQTDGKIVVVGTAVRFATDHYETFFALARYNTNGTLDPDFGTGGKVTSDVLGSNIHNTPFVVFVQGALALVIQPDNKIVVAGGIIAAEAAFGTPAPLGDFGIARFNSNGTPDTGFNGSGRVVRDFFGRNDLATSLALQADNKIVVGGYATKNVSPFDPDFAWVRYDTNGFQDTSIGNAGRVTTEFAAGITDGANAMVIQPDGKIVLGGFAGAGPSTSDMALIRYNADASLDGAFGTGGKLAINVFSGYDELFGLALAADGKLVATGGTINNSGTEDIVVARITTGGVLDPTFGTNGRVTTDFSSGDDFGAAVTLQPDGKIVVSGAADMGAFTDLAVLRYLAPPSTPPPTIQLSGATTSVNESGPQATITVTRTGDLSGVSTVAYTTSDTASKECSLNNGAASSSCDYITTVGTLQFAATETQKTINISIVDDAYDETDETFTFTLSNPTGATLGSPTSSTVTIVDNDTANGPNPIDVSSFFVRQHYIDFFSREPDAPGLAFWIGEIENCTPKPQCTEIKRINVSAAFFLSIEFQETGYLVYRFYKASYGNIPNTPVPVRFLEFLPDTQQIGKGVIVNEPGYEAKLEANKVAYAQDFVTRSRFTAAYPTTLTPTQFVDALFANAGVTPSDSDRTAAINEFGGAGNTADTAARARALRKVAENSLLFDQEKNRAFVLAQYFGYLRRNPNDPPESTLDFQGYNFWLGKLNQFNGNFIEAEMVKSFIISGEYRQRFGLN